MYEIGAKDIIEKILPVVDNFERGLAAVAEDDKEDPFVQKEWIRFTNSLMTTLDGSGVKPIEAVGQEFNPDFHNAVMHVENEEAGENMITEEFQKGYTYRDTCTSQYGEVATRYGNRKIRHKYIGGNRHGKNYWY